MFHHFIRIFESSIYRTNWSDSPARYDYVGVQDNKVSRSTIPSSQTPTLLPPFFFSLCSARCYFCCLFRSHFPPVAARSSVHPFQTLQSIPFGQDSYFLSFDTNSSKKHVLRKRIRLSSWLFFFFFLLIHISASCF